MRLAVQARGRCLLVLSGGSTPLALYRLLAREPGLPWEDITLFWGDERFVPPEHPSSNAGAALDALVNQVPIPRGQVHPWPILADPEASAAAYARLLVEIAGEEPTFDVTLLGLGSDCHTASLFPGTGAIHAGGLTVASRPAVATEPRLSLTPSALSRSRTVLFLVSGGEKRLALADLLATEGDPERCPARAIGALDRLLVVTDQQLDPAA
jgi:6-phosphogluconolactonase